MRPQQKLETLTATAAPRESLGELLSDLASQSSSLIRDEVALARQELREKVKAVESAIIIIACGAVAAFVAVLALCATVILALSEYLEPWQAALLTGIVLAIAAVIILAVGISHLRHTSLKPEQTIETLEENKEWLREIT